jgi:predicted dehydrogenase
VTAGSPVRWGVLGTANIARGAFLPGVREAGRGDVVAVASRDGSRAASFAADNDIGRGVEGYGALVDADDVDAVYIALPNTLHAAWAAEALRAGKAVLCEKPLTVEVAQTAALTSLAAAAPAPLWEAFVFPFHAQHLRLLELIVDGAIGEVREIVSAFQFTVSRPDNIRLSLALGGGACFDVGCYPIRLALELFGDLPHRAVAIGSYAGGVDVDISAVVEYPSERRLTLTCGFHRAYDAATRVLGTEGQLELTNPFHPDPSDSLTIRRRGASPIVEHPTTDQNSFTAAIRHIHSVLLDGASPRQLAADRSLPTATALDVLVQAAGVPTGGAGRSTGPSR